MIELYVCLMAISSFHNAVSTWINVGASHMEALSWLDEWGLFKDMLGSHENETLGKEMFGKSWKRNFG